MERYKVLHLTLNNLEGGGGGGDCSSRLIVIRNSFASLKSAAKCKLRAVDYTTRLPQTPAWIRYFFLIFLLRTRHLGENSLAGLGGLSLQKSARENNFREILLFSSKRGGKSVLVAKGETKSTGLSAISKKKRNQEQDGEFPNFTSHPPKSWRKCFQSAYEVTTM